MSLRLRLLESSCRVVVRLAPAHVRDAWGEDLQATFRDACSARNGVSELFDVVRASLRARFARPLQITGGEPPRLPARKGTTMQTLANDLRLAIRSLMASHVQSGIAILTLTIGIGANAAIFSVLDSLLIRPMPFAHPERLVEIFNFASESKVSFPGFKRELFREWQQQEDLFDRVEAYAGDSFIFQGQDGARTVPGAYVTPGLFPLLGVAPAQGRLFVTGDGREGTDTQVIISERFWRKSLGSRLDVIGSSLDINGRPHTVVGVLAAWFHFPYQPQDVWLPVDVLEPPAARPAGADVVPFARLQPGLSLEAARQRVNERGERLRTASGGDEGISATLQSRLEVGDPRTRQSLIVLGGSVGFLLLIVCANIANLSLARTLARSRDFAIRSALGAGRRDLVRETIVENLLVGAAGSIGGLVLAYGALALMATFIPPDMTLLSMNQIDLDGRVLGFAMLAGLFTSLLFGLPPAIMGSRANVVGILRQESKTSAGSIRSRRFRSALVVGEVTMAIVLLVGAALMARSFLKLQSVDRGFDSNGLVAIRVGLPTGPYTDPAVRDRLVEATLLEFRGMPGVRAATAGAVPPDSDLTSFAQFEFLDRPGELSEELIVPVYKVWPDYFSTIGLPLVEGRSFAADEPGTSVIVSQSFAKKYWPGQSPLGREFRSKGSSRTLTVVGVSTEVRQADMDDASGAFEWFQPMRLPPGAVARPRPNPPAIIEYRTFVIRADNPAAMLGALGQTIHRVDKRLVILDSDVVNNKFADAIARPRLVLLLLVVFASMGLLLAAAGIYGVLSYLVTQRLREIGIRIALGARPEGVFQLVLRNGLTLTLVGLVLGLGASYFLVRVMRTILYEVEPSDPVAVAGVSVLLLATAVLACWRPARRAMKVDPVRLLREQ